MRPDSPITGGELLRAVLDDAAIGADYRIYLVGLGSVGNNINAVTMRGVFQCQSDCWFLMTGIFPEATQGQGFVSNSQAEFFNLENAANQKSIINNTTLRLNMAQMNDNLESRSTLPEYILWAPASLIGVSWSGSVSQSTAITPQTYKFLCLEGIEYRF